MFVIRETPGRGLGAFATEDIPAGTVILREQPVLQLLNQEWTNHNPNVCRSLMEAFDALDDAEKARIKELYAYIPDQLVTKVEHIVDTVLAQRKHDKGTSRNEYVNLVFQMTTNEWKILGLSYDTSALYLRLSRFNHSCSANALNYEESLPDGTQVKVVRARRHVRTAEEITIEYMTPWMEDRAGYLRRTWGFDCSCSVCDSSGNSGMDHATRAEYERTFRQIRENDEDNFRHEHSTPTQILLRHQRRAAALQTLGPSVFLMNELANGVKLYTSSGDQEKVVETLKALYRVMTIVCDEDDPYRLALQAKFGP
ncbi:hypothetical protein F4777DRAFT_594153, partial [Nemania sp. FL0916]